MTNRIDEMFARKRAAGEKASLFYVTAGYPDYATTERVVAALDAAGADLLELGIPFSDPIADGPTIQKASQAALDGGATVRGILDLLARLRAKTQMPILLFTAFNPVAHMGLAKFADAALKAGADGLLVPDLPPEEAGELMEVARARGLKLVFLVAPTTRPERRAMIGAKSTGFVYYISLRGVTGARESLPADMQENLRALKGATSLPVVVGFGVSKPEHARAAGECADGVVVGSALIDIIAKHAGKDSLGAEVEAFAKSIKQALPKA